MDYRSSYKLLLRASKGKDFPDMPGFSLSCRASLVGDQIHTKSCPLDKCPEINDEIGWEFSGRRLKELRSNRMSVKITFYACKIRREEIGYVMIDTREAGEYMKLKWYTVTKTKSSKSKPAFQFALYYEKDEVVKVKPALKEWKVHARRTAPERNDVVFVPNGNYFFLKPTDLDAENELFFFQFNLTIHRIEHFDQLMLVAPNNEVSDSDDTRLHFCCCMMGRDFKTEEFDGNCSEMFAPQSITVTARSTRNGLQEYILKEKALEVILFHANSKTAIGYLNIPFSDRDFSQPGIKTIHQLTSTFEQISGLDELRARIEVSVNLCTIDRSVAAIENTAEDLESCLDSITDEYQSELFTEPETDGSVVPDPTDAVDNVTTDGSEIIVTMPETCDAANESAGVLMMFTVTLSIDQFKLSKTEWKDYSFSLRYQYPFVGATNMISTSPPCKVDDNDNKLNFHNAEAVFEFFTSLLALNCHFRSVPLVFELMADVTGEAETRRCVGSGQYWMWKVLAQDLIVSRDTTEIASMFIGKQCLTDNCKILSRDGHEPIGNLFLTIEVENLGPVKPACIPDSIAESYQTMPNSQAIEIEKLRAEVELQKWKEQQETKFQVKLKQKEVRRLLELTSLFKTKEREHEECILLKLRDNEEMNRRIKKTLTQLEQKERDLLSKEIHIKSMKLDADKKKEARIIELEERAKRLTLRIEEDSKIFGEKIRSLQEELAKERKLTVALDNRYRQKTEELSRLVNCDQRMALVKMQSQFDLLKLEKTQIERELEDARSEKSYFKELWEKSLRTTEISKNQEIIDLKKMLAEKLEEIKTLKQAIHSLEPSCSTRTDQSVNKNDMQSASMTTTDIGGGHVVNRLKQQRNSLLAAKVYSVGDREITVLDREIDRLTKSKSHS